MVLAVSTTTAADSCTSLRALSPVSEPDSSCSRPIAGRDLSAAFHTYTASTTSAASDASSDLCSDDDSSSPSGRLVNFFMNKLPSALARPRADSRRSDCRSSSGSTDAGDGLSPSSPPAWSVDGTSSDSELSDDQSSPDPFLVYPIAVLLRLRAAAVRQHAPRCSSERPSSVLGYTVRDAAEFPDLAPCASPTAKAASSPSFSPCSSPSSWAAQRKASRADEAGEDKIVRTARSILNKLTVEKFDSLYEQLATSGIQTMSHIKCLMQEVFEKATVQHHFISMYADLCMRLESDTRILPSPQEAKGRSDAFRRLLLDRCQGAFESLLEAGTGASDDDDEEAKLVRKQRALGNVKLVGQLIVRGMLSSRLLVQCSEDLLHARDSCTEALESLAAFLTVAAPPFDMARDYPFRPQLDAIFRQVSELTRDKSIAARERFLLRDVLELRDAGWHGRTCAAKPSAPMRLEEVRTTAAPAAAAPQGQQRAWQLADFCGGASGAGGWAKSPAKQGKPAASASKVDTPPRAQHDQPWKAVAPRSGNKKPQQQQPQQQAKRQPQPQQRQPATPPAAKPAVVPPAAARPSAPQAPAAAPIAAAAAPAAAAAFDQRAFRRVLSETMRELTLQSGGCGVPAAVRRIRDQHVPVSRQAAEFADILTRAAEESRGPPRRSAFAFAAGLAAADATSAFERSACIAGTAIFFREVYEDLMEEVPRLPAIVKAEMLPTLKAVLPAADLRAAAPADLWIA